MPEKRYTLYFTAATKRIIDSFEKRDYRVRDVLNAGVVLFDQADIANRGQAIAIAHGMLKEEIETAIQRIKDTVNWMDRIKNPDAFSDEERKVAEGAKILLQNLQTLLNPKNECLANTLSADQIVDAAEDDREVLHKKRGRPAVKSGKSAG